MARSPQRLLLGGVALVGIAVAAYVLVDRPQDDPGGTAVGSAPSPEATPGTSPAGDTAGAVPDPRASDAPPPPEIPPVGEVATDEPLPPSEGPAGVAVTYAGWDAASSSVHVNAYLGGVLEDGGTCTLTLSLGDETRTVSGPGLADATTTICDLLSISGLELSPGTWSAVVTYDSPTTRGSSQPEEVAVP